MSPARLKLALMLEDWQAVAMHVEPHESIEQFQALAKRESDARVARRMQAVVLARCGKTAPQVAEATGLCRRTVQVAVARYNAAGAAGLNNRPHPGKPPRLTPQQQRALCEKLDAGADYEQDKVCTFRGEEVHRFIAERFGVVYHLDHVYKLLARLGYSSLRPRPRHRKADPEAQEKWLEEAPFFSSESGSSTPTRSSVSGSRTKRASARREA